MPFSYDLSGTLLDNRYQLTRQVGKGGMGHVYEGQHVSLRQRVAVKVLHPRYAYEERFRERFIREAQSASRIRHKNVVQITDFGETPDGSVYFVMEFLQGDDVGATIRRDGPMGWSRTRYILLQAVSALAAAHNKKIIHRDIKPANCFLTTDEETGRVDFVKLLDFGIAKIGRDSHGEAESKGLTATGEVFGTAAYMSPEQAGGSPLDARSDIYSLGVMMYEMLVGRPPFVGVNALHVITQQLTDPPPPPRTLNPDIPPPVEELVLEMLQKDRVHRVPSMAMVQQRLRKIPESLGTARGKTLVNQPRGSWRPQPRVASGMLGSPDRRPGPLSPSDGVNKRVFAQQRVSPTSVPPPAPDVASPVEANTEVSTPIPVGMAPNPYQPGPSAQPVLPALPPSVAAASGPTLSKQPHAWSEPMPAGAAASWSSDADIAGESSAVSGTSGTGPFVPGGPAMPVDTSPHSFEQPTPVFSRGMLAVVVLLVILVSAGSVFATLGILAISDDSGPATRTKSTDPTK